VLYGAPPRVASLPPLGLELYPSPPLGPELSTFPGGYFPPGFFPGGPEKGFNTRGLPLSPGLCGNPGPKKPFGRGPPICGREGAPCFPPPLPLARGPFIGEGILNPRARNRLNFRLGCPHAGVKGEGPPPAKWLSQRAPLAVTPLGSAPPRPKGAPRSLLGKLFPPG